MKTLLTVLFFCLAVSPTQATVTVDNCLDTLTFDVVPERMVVHDLNMTEMAFALGLQGHIIGVSGITGWYKTGPEFKASLGKIQNWRLNIGAWAVMEQKTGLSNNAQTSLHT